MEPEPHLDVITRIYEEALRLWSDTGVERHAEGHPGVAGPAGNDEKWTRSQGMLDGAISTLQIIRERAFSYLEDSGHPAYPSYGIVGPIGIAGEIGPDHIPQKFWKECPCCHEVHHPIAGCAGPPGPDYQEAPPSSP